MKIQLLVSGIQQNILKTQISSENHRNLKHKIKYGDDEESVAVERICDDQKIYFRNTLQREEEHLCDRGVKTRTRECLDTFRMHLSGGFTRFLIQPFGILS